jgi:hypothetical protein
MRPFTERPSREGALGMLVISARRPALAIITQATSISARRRDLAT